jgi:hypothetical protein
MSDPITPENIKAELDRIAAASGGTLTPAAVVDAARGESNPLHHRFCWDDTRAAELYRLEQARHLIRVCVQFTKPNEPAAPVWVSLEPDRGETGYRKLVDVIADKDMRDQLLEQAKADMRRFCVKYEMLKAVRPVIAAMRRVK